MKKVLLCGVALVSICGAVKAQGKFSETAQRALRASEVNNLSYAKTRYALNEMYARHGYTFRDKAITREFRRYSWYHPVKGRTMQQAEARFNYYEKVNSKVLGRRKVTLASSKSSGSTSPGKPSTNKGQYAASSNLRGFPYRGYWTQWTGPYANNSPSLRIDPNGRVFFGDTQYPAHMEGNQLVIVSRQGDITRFIPHDNGTVMEMIETGDSTSKVLTKRWSN